MLADPVPVFLDVAGIDHQHVFVLVDAVDEQIVDNAAPAVGQVAVLHFAIVERGGIVGRHALDQVEGVGPLEHELAHMRDVEHADCVANGVVFVEIGRITNGHLEARKRDNLGPGLLMKRM